MSISFKNTTDFTESVILTMKGNNIFSKWKVIIGVEQR